MEIIKNVSRWGNSAGVLLPREWLDGKVQIKLVEKPINLEKDILEILMEENMLKDVMGVYIVGSYARNEQTAESDIDILVITKKIDKRIKSRRYDILLISKELLEEKLKSNILPLLPMLREAKPIINAELIENYKKAPLTKRNLKFHIETTKSAVEINKEAIEISKLENNNYCSDAVAYSIVLRAREAYLVECMINQKRSSNKEFKKLIQKKSGSLLAYEGYLRAKNNEPVQEKLPVEEAEKIIGYIDKKIIEQEKWIKREESK